MSQKLSNLIHLIKEYRNAPDTAPQILTADIMTEWGVQDPRTIVKGLDEYIIGQHTAKKALALMMFNRYLRILNLNSLIDLEIQKSNVLLIGSTGTGKTSMMQALSDVCELPILIFDIGHITGTGWSGPDLSSLLMSHIDIQSSLYAKFYGNVELDEEVTEREIIRFCSEFGIIYIDEVDKLKSYKDYNDFKGFAIQNELLRYLEGSHVTLSSSKNALGVDSLDTTQISFVLGGAFQGLDDIISDRLYKGSSMGFSGDVMHKSKDHIDPKLLSQVTTEDLVQYGFKPEFIGRIATRAALDSHTRESLVQVIETSKNSIFLQYRDMFKVFGIDLRLEQSGIDEIVTRALDLKTGARALKTVFYTLLEDRVYNMFDLLGQDLVIDKQYVNSIYGK